MRATPTTYVSRGALALTVAALGACGGTSDPDPDGNSGARLSDEAVIEYRYVDAAVDPEHHRSYTLTITSGEVEVAVDSYGDVIDEATVLLPRQVWDELAGDIATVEAVDTGDDRDVDGCTGGTGRVIAITDGDETVVDFAIEVCGNENEARATRLDGYVQPVIAAIPDWDDLVEGSG